MATIWKLFGNANDTLKAPASTDTYVVSGGGGNNSIATGSGHDLLKGGLGNNSLDGGAGNDTLRGEDGTDALFGGAGNDLIDGGAARDLIWDGAGNDTIYGGAGNDQILTSGGNDLVYGGDGDDGIIAESLYTTHTEDWTLDTVYGGAGNDEIEAGAGWTAYGGTGDDRYWLTSNSTKIVEYANEGIDTAYVDAGKVKLLTMAANLENVELRSKLSDGTGGYVIGNAGANVIKGALLSDTLLGGGGDDQLSGAGGNDTLWGGANQDTLRGEDGDDSLDGGAGYDSLDGGNGNDRLVGGSESDTLAGGAGNDLLFGGTEGDLLNGGDGNDDLRGEAGDDSLRGDAGSDTLSGGDGKDILRGGDGNDLIVGGAGGDVLFGDAGADLFRFNTPTESSATTGQDVIGDFEHGIDRIDLVSIDANSLVAGDQAFSFFAEKPVAPTAGALWQEQVGGSVNIYGDVNGDGAADFVVGREQSRNHNSFWMLAINNYYFAGINTALEANYETILNNMKLKDVQDLAKEFISKAKLVDVIFVPKGE